MTVPPDEGQPPAGAHQPEPPLDFDPYRFGKPDHPIAPEYAPPGYRPDPVLTPPQFSYPPPPNSAPYGVTRPGNSRARIALTLGILAIVFSFASVYDLVLAIPAIVMGLRARRDARNHPERGGWNTATGGLVCGLVAMALIVATTVYVVVKISPCIKQDSSFNEMTTCAKQKINSGN